MGGIIGLMERARARSSSGVSSDGSWPQSPCVDAASEGQRVSSLNVWVAPVRRMGAGAAVSLGDCTWNSGTGGRLVSSVKKRSQSPY